MLSELGKYGASFALATQSLSKLDQTLDRPCATRCWPTSAASAVFQVAGDDARQLVWELNRERLSEEDIVSQPVHHCYVRATVGTRNARPTFSMQVRKPEFGDPEAGRPDIRRAASALRHASSTGSQAQEAELSDASWTDYREGVNADRRQWRAECGRSRSPTPGTPDAAVEQRPTAFKTHRVKRGAG